MATRNSRSETRILLFNTVRRALVPIIYLLKIREIVALRCSASLDPVIGHCVYPKTSRMSSILLWTSLVLVSFSSNRLNIFGCGHDRSVHHKSWNGNQWLPSKDTFDTLGASSKDTFEIMAERFKGKPTAVTWPGSGNMAVASVDQDGNMWWITGSSSGSWGNWTNAGGSFDSAPTSCSWGSNSWSVAGIGKDRALWTGTNTGSGWSNWESLGGTFFSAPSMVSWGTNQRSVMGVGTDRGLWVKTWSGNSWGGWQGLGGTFISIVIVISRAPGYMNVYGIGTDQQVSSY